jgi:hypothetical protein
MASALPQAVQKQVDEANELIEKIYPVADSDAPAPAEGEEAPVLEDTPPVEEVVPPNKEVDFEHKYNVLQGKYNAEVPRLSRQVQEQDGLISDIRQQLTNTQTMLASMSQGKSAVPNEEVVSPASPAPRLVQDDEIREFGPDLYDFIKRTAQEAVDIKAATQPLEQRLGKAEQQALSAVQSVARDQGEKVLNLLSREVPKWETQNTDEAFLTWLLEVDPYTGSERGKLLSQAFASHDGPRVVAFFKGFLNENAVVTTPTPAPAPPDETPIATPAEGQGLEGLVAPGTPKSGVDSGAPNEAGKRVWTQPLVTDLYAKINEFTKRGKQAPKELRALEADLIRAQTEGRIQA